MITTSNTFVRLLAAWRRRLEDFDIRDFRTRGHTDDGQTVYGLTDPETVIVYV
jgi:hypothetical protein